MVNRTGLLIVSSMLTAFAVASCDSGKSAGNSIPDGSSTVQQCLSSTCQACAAQYCGNELMAVFGESVGNNSLHPSCEGDACNFNGKQCPSGVACSCWASPYVSLLSGSGIMIDCPQMSEGVCMDAMISLVNCVLGAPCFSSTCGTSD